jgi:hypothetical protein
MGQQNESPVVKFNLVCSMYHVMLQMYESYFLKMICKG